MIKSSSMTPRSERTPWHRRSLLFAAGSTDDASQPSTPAQPYPDAGVGVDVIFVLVVMTVFFAVFYRRWPLSEDHAIYHYMAWGLRHGLVPYRDTINMNWPGAIVIHLVARAISGSDGLGLRLLDSLFLVVLSAASAVLLRAYRVSAPLRLLGLTSYLATYFLNDYVQTAQRESFELPLVAVGLACCLIQARWEQTFSRWVTVACGLTAGLGLSIKPALVLPLLFAQVLPVVVRPSRKEGYRFVFWFTVGEVAAAVCTVGFLTSFGSLSGFFDWGVQYAFGPYANARWSIENRLYHTVNYSLWAPSSLLAMAGVFALLTGMWGRRERLAWQGPVVFSLVALIALATVFAQGKTHCRYHFHPYFWALSLVGASALQASLTRAERFATIRLALVFCASVLAMLTIEAVYRRQPLTPDGTQFASYLRERLAPNDEFVLFGFAPTVHSRIARRTPFPFVDSWVILTCCDDGARPRIERQLGERLAISVREPRVKCVLLQRNLGYVSNQKWVPGDQIVAKYLSDADLHQLGYSHSSVTLPGGTSFDVWMRGLPLRSSLPSRPGPLSSIP